MPEPTRTDAPLDLAEVTLTTFEPLVGRMFRLHAAPGEVLDVRLASAEAAEAAPDAPRAPFTLLFVDPGGRYLPQAIYRLEQDALGAVELFLVPVGPDGSGMQFEAIFA